MFFGIMFLFASPGLARYSFVRRSVYAMFVNLFVSSIMKCGSLGHMY
jgi:hypothetical protein